MQVSRWLINPVLGKALKLRFRSFKGMLGLMFYLAVLALIALGFVYLTAEVGNSRFSAADSHNLFITLSVVQVVLIAFMTPGLTAGVISSEREKQTLDILLTTQQASSTIILSKWLASIAYLLLMVVASLPLYSITFLYGGVSPQMLLAAFAVFILMMMTFAGFGVLFSTFIRKTIVSMITTYGVVLFLTAGTAVMFVFFSNSIFSMSAVDSATNWLIYIIMALNPFFVLFSVIQDHFIQAIVANTGITLPLWAGFLICYGLLTIAVLFLSIRKLRPHMTKG